MIAVAAVAGAAIVAWIGAAGVVSYRTSAVLEKENLSRLVVEIRAAKERESALTEQLRRAEDTIQKLRPAPEVHLSPGAILIRRDSSDSRAYPLNEPGRPSGTGKTDPAARVRLLHNIIDWLDVAHSARYERTPVQRQPGVYTIYSNIYAHDYAYLAGVYLPRVWWTARAVEAIHGGSIPDVKYGTTVHEMDQNAICDWLSRSGVEYGWRAARNLTVLQAAANEGKVALICAANVDSRWAGDIALVVPESGDQKAVRQGSEVTRPLQSKAGITNSKYGTPVDAWWSSREYRLFGFWYHEPKGACPNRRSSSCSTPNHPRGLARFSGFERMSPNWKLAIGHQLSGDNDQSHDSRREIPIAPANARQVAFRETPPRSRFSKAVLVGCPSPRRSSG